VPEYTKKPIEFPRGSGKPVGGRFQTKFGYQQDELDAEDNGDEGETSYSQEE
jgi:hypothetical protein